MKKVNELEDTLEKQEKKELIFELCYKIFPLVFLLVTLLLAAIFKWNSRMVFRNEVELENGRFGKVSVL